MKKILSFFGFVMMMALFCFTFIACGDDDVDKKVEEAFIEVNPASLKFSWESGEQSVVLKSNTFWIVASNPKWVKFSSLSGQGDAVLTISVEANEDKEARTGVLMIQGGNISKTISIEQASNDGKKEEDEDKINLDDIIGSWVNLSRNFEYLELTKNGTAVYEWYINDKLAGYSVPNKGIKATGTYQLSERGELEIKFPAGNVNVDIEWGMNGGFVSGRYNDLTYYDISREGNTLRMMLFDVDTDDSEQVFIKAENYTPQKYGMDYSGSENGHGYVDLGLSVKWATTSLGADAPQAYGPTYDFGESGSNNDPAVKAWGGAWRLPTIAEAQELISKCKVRVINSRPNDSDYGNHWGYILTGPSGKSIYFPGNPEGSNAYMTGEKMNSRIVCIFYNANKFEVTDLYGSKYMVRPVFSGSGSADRDLTAPEYVEGTVIGAWKTNYDNYNYNMMVFYADGICFEISCESGKYYVHEGTYTYNNSTKTLVMKRRSMSQSDVLIVTEVNANRLALSYNGDALAPYDRFTGTLPAAINKVNSNGEYEGY